jgi:hypothetical protein
MNAGDTAWVLVSTGLVMLMLPGLALFYGGLVSSRTVLVMATGSVSPRPKPSTSSEWLLLHGPDLAGY